MNNNDISTSWWLIPTKELVNTLHTDPANGLTTEQIKQSRAIFGQNIIATIEPISIRTLILDGIKQPMILVLLAIAVFALIFGNFHQAIAMIFVVAAYIAVELFNKYRSDRLMSTLYKLTMPTARVIRNGSQTKIPTTEIVVGDIIILFEGSIIPGDARLLESTGLLINQAPLTGESAPIEKNASSTCSQDTPVLQCNNSIFAGCTVMAGQAKAVVTAIGKKSQFGAVALAVTKTKKEQTILQTVMTTLAKILTIFALSVSALIPFIGFLRGLDLQHMIMTWLSLTFLMVPGQPPIIITMALALAAFKLAKVSMLTKRLRGIEVLGQITAIVTDKTGTITENKMRIKTFITADGTSYTPENLPKEIQATIALALPTFSNDPTDQAVKEAIGTANKAEPIDFKNFSQEKPWRTFVYKKDTCTIAAMAGQPEALIATAPPEQQALLHQHINQAAEQGNRVIAFGDTKQYDPKQENITFIALAILHDPLRPGVKQAFADLEQASIKTIIVTGDHPATTKEIAKQAGLDVPIMTGQDLLHASDQDIADALQRQTMFARTD